MFNKLFIFLLTFIILLGCSKERPETFVQGQGQQDLWEISKFQGKYYDVQTTDTLIEKNASQADKLTLSNGDDRYEHINNFNLVNYKTNSNLLKDVPFQGKEYSLYKVRYKITNNQLLVMKVATKELFPTQELDIATKIPGTELYEVELIGYPISLHKVENIKDSNGNDTSKLNPFPATDLSNSTHFRLDLSNRIESSKLDKNDVFPSNYFDGEWFYAATVISTTPERGALVGRYLSEDEEQEYASRIKVIRSVNSIIGVNANIDKNIEINNEIKAKTVIEIPVAWIDYEKEKIGKNSILNKKEKKSGDFDAKPWRKRKYMKIDFANTKSVFGLGQNHAAIDPKIQNLKITKDYISFIIYYPEHKMKIKYALRKAQKKYKKGRIYFKKDQKRFGFFDTKKKYLKNYKTHYAVDHEEKTLLNRFYPDNGIIEYRFTHNSPKRLRPLGRKAVASWNDIFQKANTRIKIVLNEKDGDVDLGDIRVNTINIIDTKDSAFISGYGPSIADTKSGEIISATANLYVNDSRNTLAAQIRKYIRYRLGMYDNSMLNNVISITDEATDLRPMITFFKHSEIKSPLKLDSLNIKSFFKINQEYFNQVNTKQISSFNKKQKNSKNLNKNSLNPKFGETCNYKSSASDMINRIEKNCSKVFLPYVEELISQNITHDSREVSMISSCILKIQEESLLPTLVHEMGHNFGLRHNFNASNDFENYYKKDETNGNLVKTSSTMDYGNGVDHELLKPGLYDLAAIRFGYANSIETEDNQFVKLNINKSISDNLLDLNIIPKKYKYCTDTDIGMRDPLCKKWDSGKNPLEVVNSIKATYFSTLQAYGRRFDRAKGSLQINFDNYFIERVFIPLKQIYEHWRYLLTQFTEEKLLENYSIDDFKDVLIQMKNDKGIHGENYKNYYAASNEVYEFFKDIITMQARYCVTQDLDDQSSELNYLDFDKVRSKVYRQSKVSIFDCNEESALDFFSSNNQKLVRTVGNFFNGVTESVDINRDPELFFVGDHIVERVNIIGTESIRMLAMKMLAYRQPTLIFGNLDNNNTNFLDDPRYRQEIIKVLVTRIFNGSSTKQLGTDDLEDRNVPLFEKEKNLLISSFLTMINGILVPGNNAESLKRLTPFKSLRAGVNDAKNNLPEGIDQTQIENIVYYAESNRFFAKTMIERINYLEYLSEIKGETVKLFTFEHLTEMFKDKFSFIKLKNLNEITLGDLSAFVVKIRDEIESIKDKEVLQLAKIILAQELEIASLIDKYGEQLKELAERKAVNVRVGKFRFKPEEIICNEEIFNKRLQAFIKEQTELKSNAEKYTNNEEEFISQNDMLRLLVQIIGNI